MFFEERGYSWRYWIILVAVPDQSTITQNFPADVGAAPWIWHVRSTVAASGGFKVHQWWNYANHVQQGVVWLEGLGVLQELYIKYSYRATFLDRQRLIFETGTWSSNTSWNICMRGTSIISTEAIGNFEVWEVGGHESWSVLVHLLMCSWWGNVEYL